MYRFFLVLALVLIAPTALSADIGFPNLGEPLIVNITPVSPGPGAVVKVNINSYLIDLDRAAISWFVDGVQKDATEGKTELSITLGRLGTETNIAVRVIDASGVAASFSTTIHPTELDLLWEANTYTPPLYRGRALPSSDSLVTAYAEARFVRPNAARIQPDDIIYTWRFNGAILAESGRGKSSVHIPILSMYGEDALSVEATSVDGKFTAFQVVQIPLRAPHFTLYRSHPLLGIDYHNALADTAQVKETEITVAALPFFARADSPRDRDLLYLWSVGGISVPTDATNPYLLTLSVKAGAVGATTIEVAFNHARNALQSARRLWHIELAPDAGLNTDPFTRSVD